MLATLKAWTTANSSEKPSSRSFSSTRRAQLGESLEPERVYERFHELLADVVQHDGLVVSSYDERDDLIRAEYVWTEGEILDPSTLPPVPLNREGGGMQSRVIVSGEPLLFNDVADRVTQKDGVYYNVDREEQSRSFPSPGPPERMRR